MTFFAQRFCGDNADMGGDHPRSELERGVYLFFDVFDLFGIVVFADKTEAARVAYRRRDLKTVSLRRLSSFFDSGKRDLFWRQFAREVELYPV